MVWPFSRLEWRTIRLTSPLPSTFPQATQLKPTPGWDASTLKPSLLPWKERTSRSPTRRESVYYSSTNVTMQSTSRWLTKKRTRWLPTTLSQVFTLSFGLKSFRVAISSNLLLRAFLSTLPLSLSLLSQSISYSVHSYQLFIFSLLIFSFDDWFHLSNSLAIYLSMYSLVESAPRLCL